MATNAAGPNTPLLEWIAAGVGLMFLSGLLGVIGYDALSGSSGEMPAIAIQTKGVSKAGSGYVVAFSAVNSGGGTAAALEIEGQLLDGEKIIETSSATIDYVPGHGSADGGLFFSHDPRTLEVSARPLGFQDP